MVRLMLSLALVVFVTGLQAEELKVLAADATKTACAKGGCGAGCPIEAALAKLPQLTYQVGDKACACPVEAKSIAQDKGMEVKYVVAEKVFTDQAKAKLALVEATESFVKGFVTPSKCEVSGKITLAGNELCCEIMADEKAKLASDAMKKIQFTYLVGDKSCDCPLEARALAKETGKPKLFVVAGEKTACQVTARLNLTRAKYKAAVEALTKAEEKEQTKSDS